MTALGRVAVMQPYLYPYLGYVHLLDAVDTFVVLDDVQYVKRSWINRNRILDAGKEVLITLPVAKASQNRRIDQHQLADPDTNRAALADRIRQAYRWAPEERAGWRLLEPLESADAPTDLVEFLVETIETVATLITAPPTIVRSSELGVPRRATAQQRIIDLALAVDATAYVNLPGGRALYEESDFRDHGLALTFVEPALDPYEQPGTDRFVPALSILDAAFCCDDHGLVRQIEAYRVHAD